MSGLAINSYERDVYIACHVNYGTVYYMNEESEGLSRERTLDRLLVMWMQFF